MITRFTGLVLVFLVTFAIGGYAMIQTMTIEELSGEAEIIAIGTLKITNKLPKDNQGWVKIQNTVVLSEILKGTANAGSEVIIETLEGMEDMPVFEPRTRFIVFLNKSPNGTTFQTTNMIQGYWPLDRDNKPTGMGLGTSLENLKAVIAKGPATKTNSASDTRPTF